MNSILFDLAATQPDDQGSVHGGGIYAEVVFHKLLELKKSSDVIEVYYFKNKKLPNEIIETLENAKIKRHEINKLTELQEILDMGSYSVLYSALPYSMPRDLDFKDTRFVQTIHGLRPIEQPSDSQQKFYLNSFTQFKRWVRGVLIKPFTVKKHIDRFNSLVNMPNSSIWVVSNHTKASILKYLPDAKSNNIRVAYSPLMEKHFESDFVPPIYEDYFLILNANRWIKNSRRGILAVQQFFKKHPDSKTKVIVLGAKPLPNMLKLDERFIVKGYVSRHDLECHLKFAKALIYPTLNEGFGYPPLEAMKYETPVIASDICSVPEVCGSAAIYVNPFSVESIAEGIERLESHESIGLKQYTKIKKLQDEMLLWLCNDILSQHKT